MEHRSAIHHSMAKSRNIYHPLFSGGTKLSRVAPLKSMHAYAPELELAQLLSKERGEESAKAEKVISVGVTSLLEGGP